MPTLSLPPTSADGYPPGPRIALPVIGACYQRAQTMIRVLGIERRGFTRHPCRCGLQTFSGRQNPDGPSEPILPQPRPHRWGHSRSATSPSVAGKDGVIEAPPAIAPSPALATVHPLVLINTPNWTPSSLDSLTTAVPSRPSLPSSGMANEMSPAGRLVAIRRGSRRCPASPASDRRRRGWGPGQRPDQAKRGRPGRPLRGESSRASPWSCLPSSERPIEDCKARSRRKRAAHPPSIPVEARPSGFCRFRRPITGARFASIKNSEGSRTGVAG